MSKPSMKFHGNVREFLSLDTVITIADNRTAIVENCTAIEECNEILSRVKSREFEIEIWGQDLSVSNFKTKSVAVSGRIEKVVINRLSSKKEK